MTAIKFLFVLVTVVLVFVSCQPGSDIQTQQILADMKSKLELLQNQKSAEMSQDSTIQNEIRALVSGMRTLKETIELGQNVKQEPTGISEERFAAQNKEMDNIKAAITNILSEKEKINEAESQILTLEEKIKKLEDMLITIETETIRNLFDSQTKIMSGLSESLKRIADATPAEYSRQLQEQNITLNQQNKEFFEKNTELQEEIHDLTSRLERRDEQFKNLNQKYTDLQLEMTKLKETKPDTSPAGITETPDTPQMLQGRVASFMLSGDYYTTIVSFPKGSKITDNMRFNVFNNKGERIGFFRVTAADLDTSTDRTFMRCGGEVYVTEGKILETGYRVSTLSSMPDITSSGR